VTTARRLHHRYEDYLAALEISGVAVINPTLLVEVTSHSTEDYDRGEKLNHYRQCASVRAVLFVSHRRPQVTIVARTDAGWEQHERRAGEHVELNALALRFGVDELYDGIALEP
jgi:Uma2 family endonuclease